MALVNAPRGFRGLLGRLPERVVLRFGLRGASDVVVFFVKHRTELEGRIRRLARGIKSSGCLWIAWPKQASGVQTDLSGSRVRRIGLAAGLVDVKVCAVDDVWSALKFVVRVKDRRP